MLTREGIISRKNEGWMKVRARRDGPSSAPEDGSAAPLLRSEREAVFIR